MFPQEYYFVPKTYIFPFDYDRFQFIRDQSEKDQLWIQKPVASACGRNIKILSKDSPIPKKKNVLVSEYISRPHLINHLKYDLRLYVLITSYNPLRIYLFQNGLVRFATE
jgi:tubulin polyglutamylase TTLL4